MVCFARRGWISRCTANGKHNYASGFDKVYAYATAGGADDRAYLYDSAGNGTFTGRPTYSVLTGTGFYNYLDLRLGLMSYNPNVSHCSNCRNA